MCLILNSTCNFSQRKVAIIIWNKHYVVHDNGSLSYESHLRNM